MHAHITVTLFCAFLTSVPEDTADDNNGASLLALFLCMGESTHCAIVANADQCIAGKKQYLKVENCTFMWIVVDNPSETLEEHLPSFGICTYNDAIFRNAPKPVPNQTTDETLFRLDFSQQELHSNHRS
jgi:hypothetical protein